MYRALSRLGVVALAWGLSPETAAAQEYRSFTLSDGRAVIAEVLETEAAGMRVRLPQGELVIPFDVLSDMVPVDPAAYDGQAPMRVMVAEAGPRENLVKSLRHVPQVEIIAPTNAQKACDASDVACLTAGAGEPWSVVIALTETERGWTVSSAVSSGTEIASIPSLQVGDEAALTDAAGILLGLAVAAWQPVKPVEQPKPTGGDDVPVADVGEPWDRDQVIRASFAPIPGLPSIRQGDGAGFGLAMVVVVPTTAAWVGVVGKSAQTVPEHAVLGAAGFYTATVLANQIFGLRSMERSLSVAVAPSPDGAGSMVVVTRQRGSGRTSPTR